MTGRVAVVVPVYDNTETLAALTDRLDAALTVPWTLRLVVDACPRGSADEAARLAARDRRISVTTLARNVGQHRAIATGLAAEPTAAAWVCLDGDLQDPPEAVPDLVAAVTDHGASVAFAGRCGTYQGPGRSLTGRAHRRLLTVTAGVPADAGAFLAMDVTTRDSVVDAVLHRNAPSVVAAAALACREGGGGGSRVVSLPVRRDPRPVGESSWTSYARLRQSVRTLRWAARNRVGTSSLARQAGGFAVIGVAGVAAYLLVYLGLRLALPAQPANLAARVLVAVPTTWANGRHIFCVRISAARLVTGTGALLLAGMAVTSALLAVEQTLLGPDRRPAELATLAAATALATVIRFQLLRHWVFRPTPA